MDDLLKYEEIAAFMYLISEIKKKELYKVAKNKPKDIAKNGSFEDYHYATTITVRRALRLYENLLAEKIIERGYNRPCRRTLNVLAQYHSFYKGKTKTMRAHVFEYFKEKNKNEIDAYYSGLNLSDELSNAILNKNISKIEHCRAHKNGLVTYKKQVNDLSLEGFKKLWVKPSNREFLENEDLIVLKKRFIDYFNNGIDKTKFILFWYSIFGTIVFLFVSMPEYLDLQEYLMDVLDGLIINDTHNEYVEEEDSSESLAVAY